MIFAIIPGKKAGPASPGGWKGSARESRRPNHIRPGSLAVRINISQAIYVTTADANRDPADAKPAGCYPISADLMRLTLAAYISPIALK